MKNMKKMGSFLKSCSAEVKDSGVEDVCVTPRGKEKEKEKEKERLARSSKGPGPSTSSVSITVHTVEVQDKEAYGCRFGVDGAEGLQGAWQALPAEQGVLVKGESSLDTKFVVTWNSTHAIPAAAAGATLAFVLTKAGRDVMSGKLALDELAPGETFQTAVRFLGWPMIVSLKGIRPREEPAITLWGLHQLPTCEGAVKVEFGVPGRSPMHCQTRTFSSSDSYNKVMAMNFKHKELLPRNIQAGDKVKVTVTLEKTFRNEHELTGELELGGLSPEPGSRFDCFVRLAGRPGWTNASIILHGVRPADATEEELKLEADQIRQECDFRKWNAAGRPGATVTPETFPTYGHYASNPPAKLLVSVADRPDTRSVLYVDEERIKETGLREVWPLQGVSGSLLEFTFRKKTVNMFYGTVDLETKRGTLQLGGLASDPAETYRREVVLKGLAPFPVILRGVRPSDLSEEEARPARLADQVKAREELMKRISGEVRELLGGMFDDMLKAQRVDIISTPYYKAGKRPGQKGYDDTSGAAQARAFKAKHDSKPKRFVFNPNDDLQDIAQRKGWDALTQERKWVEAWTTVLMIVKQTGGTCYVMRKKKGESGGELEGNAQQGEVNIMLLADCIPEYVDY